jgi:outer membrane lipoprotein-sorting protein
MTRSHRLLLLAALVLPTSAMAAEAPTLDEVLERHYEARGGLDEIRALRSYRSTGTMTMAGMAMPYVTEAKRPGKLRVEFTAQGMTGIQAVDGSSGWHVMPFMGILEPTAMQGDDLRNLRNQADIDGPLVDWQAKGHTVELVGPGEIDGADVVTLKITLNGGGEILSHLDAERYLDLKWQMSTTMNGQPVRVGIDFGDYRPAGALTLPHSMAQTIEGMPGVQSFVIERYEVNADIDDSRFAFPVKAAVEATAEAD